MGSSYSCSCQTPYKQNEQMEEIQILKGSQIESQKGITYRVEDMEDTKRIQSNEFEYEDQKLDSFRFRKKQMSFNPSGQTSETRVNMNYVEYSHGIIQNPISSDLVIQIISEYTVLKIPTQVVEGLKMVGELVINPHLLDMFQDCEQQEPVKLDNGRGIYEGQWSHGIRNGYGKLLYEDFSYYEGYWINNQRHFQGRFVDKDGDAYVGQWFSDKTHGEGQFYHRDGTFYEMHSGFQYRSKKYKTSKEPSITYPDGKFYYGPLVNGQRHGFGLFIQADLTEYIGNFKNDQQDGFGYLAYDDGRTFQGSWIDGIKNGLGEFSWPNGQVYIGNYKDDAREGYGFLIYSNGQKYRGQYLNGEMTGIGRMIDKKGHYFEAEWENGRRTQESKLNRVKMRYHTENLSYKLDYHELESKKLQAKKLAEQNNNYTHNPWSS